MQKWVRAHPWATTGVVVLLVAFFGWRGVSTGDSYQDDDRYDTVLDAKRDVCGRVNGLLQIPALDYRSRSPLTVAIQALQDRLKPGINAQGDISRDHKLDVDEFKPDLHELNLALDLVVKALDYQVERFYNDYPGRGDVQPGQINDAPIGFQVAEASQWCDDGNPVRMSTDLVDRYGDRLVD